MTERSGNEMGAALVYMIILSILLFWLPLIGPFIAGYVGGKKAGSLSSGVGASLIPAVIVAIFPFILGIAGNMPIIGAIAAGGIFVVLVLMGLPLIAGAAVGGSVAETNTKTIQASESSPEPDSSPASTSSNPPQTKSTNGGPQRADFKAASDRQEEIECLECGAVSSLEAKFCAACGAELTPLECSNCGEGLRPTDEFCPECGTQQIPDGIASDRLVWEDVSPVQINYTSGGTYLCGRCREPISEYRYETCPNCHYPFENPQALSNFPDVDEDEQVHPEENYIRLSDTVSCSHCGAGIEWITKDTGSCPECGVRVVDPDSIPHEIQSISSKPN